jgi:hypothetical protein
MTVKKLLNRICGALRQELSQHLVAASLVDAALHEREPG